MEQLPIHLTSDVFLKVSDFSYETPREFLHSTLFEALKLATITLVLQFLLLATLTLVLYMLSLVC